MSGKQRARRDNGSSSSPSGGSSSQQPAPLSNALQHDSLPDVASSSSTPLLDLVQQHEKNPTYSHVDVNTALLKLDRAGNFKEESKTEYDTTKARLELEKGGSASDREVRVAMLEVRMREADANRALAQASAGDSEQVMGLFMAPEWALGKNLTEEDMAYYDASFQALSAQMPHTLMAPGSGVWQERRKKGTFTKENVLHNTANVYLGGERKAQVHKQAEGMDIDHAVHRFKGGQGVDTARSRKWWDKAPERSAPGSATFSAGGRRFGLDICADHGNSRVTQQVIGGHEAPLDMQLLMSAGAQPMEAGTAVKDGGMIAHSDASGVGQLKAATGGDTVYHAGVEGMKTVKPWAPKPNGFAGYERSSLVQKQREDFGPGRKGHLGKHKF